MPRIGIALGSNLGDRLQHLQAARDLLVSLSTGPLLAAPVYLTEPVNCPPGSPDFLNTVVEISYDGPPAELLGRTQAFQRELGRIGQTERNAPRVIDIDLLYFGDQIITTDVLELPHPRLTRRQFVLRPLADIRPELILPGDDRTIADHLRDLEEEELEIVTADW